MFEVGKKYKSKNGDWIGHCLLVVGSKAVLETTRGISLWDNYDFDAFTEYKEPIKHVRYFNVYRNFVSGGHVTRKNADKSSHLTRVGCVRVEFTEGQYDD